MRFRTEKSESQNFLMRHQFDIMAKEPAFWYTDIQALLVVAPCREPQPRGYSTFEVGENVLLSPYGGNIIRAAARSRKLEEWSSVPLRGETLQFQALSASAWEWSSVPLRGETAKVLKNDNRTADKTSTFYNYNSIISYLAQKGKHEKQIRIIFSVRSNTLSNRWHSEKKGIRTKNDLFFQFFLFHGLL